MFCCLLFMLHEFCTKKWKCQFTPHAEVEPMEMWTMSMEMLTFQWKFNTMVMIRWLPKEKKKEKKKCNIVPLY